MPARISPITTGTKRRPAMPSSGPPKPASTIIKSIPKLMGTPSQLCAAGDHAAGDPARAQERTRRVKPLSEWWDGRRVHGVWAHSACERGPFAR